MYIHYLENRKHFQCFHFPYSYRNTSESLVEREIEVGTRARIQRECFHAISSSPKLSRVFLYVTYRNRGEMFSISFIK